MPFLEKLIMSQLARKYSALYGTRLFIIVYTRALISFCLYPDDYGIPPTGGSVTFYNI
jgi:hypothetical protein